MLRLSRLPLPPVLQRLTGFSLFVWRRAMQNRCLQVAASLTFTTLLSLVPLITITLIVVAAFPVFEELSSQFKEFLLRNLVPDFAGRIISVYLKQFTDNAGRLTAVGLALLAFTSLSLMLTIDRTFNAKKSHFLPILQYLVDLPDSVRTNFHFEVAIDYLDEEVLDDE